MKKYLFNYYWTLIFIVQIYLLIDKFSKNDFYAWNIVALISSAIFLYNRIRFNKILKNSESIIILFLIFNSISTFIKQLVILNSFLKLFGSIIICLCSFFTIFYLGKNNGKK